MRASAAVLALALAATSALAEPERIRLAVGSQRTLGAEGVERASLADSAICDLTRTADGKELLLTAKRPGKTDLLLWLSGGGRHEIAIEVSAADAPGIAAQIREILDGVHGVTVKAVGDKVILDGRVLTAKDQRRVKAVAEAYPQVVDLTALDLSAHTGLIASEIERKIGFALVRVEIAGERAILRGTVFREEDRKVAAAVAAAHAPEVVDLLSVDPPMTEIDVKFVLVRRDRLKERGANLLKTLGGEASAEGEPASLSFGLSASALLRVRELTGAGEAELVAEPFLTATSGKEAVFHAGGEQGYRVSGTGAADVKFKKHGLLLTVLPTVASDGKVRTRLSIEVSAPSKTAAGGDLAYTTFRTESEVSGRVDQTIVVSGLSQGLRERFREETPVLGRIPILAELFREKGARTEDREMVLLATPRVPALREAAEARAADRILPGGAPPEPDRGR